MSNLEMVINAANLPPHLKEILLKVNGEQWQVLQNICQQQARPVTSKILCPERPGDLFSKVEIDTELSKLDENEISIVQWIYKELAYSSKMDYFTGCPQFAMRSLDFSAPNVENIIVGECQSGKSAEISWIAWCSYFILGCLPVIYIRNNGGKTQGTEDMVNAIKRMNQRIHKALEKAEIEMPTLRDKIRRLIDNRRFDLEVVTEEGKIEADGLTFRCAKVLISLLNATHLRRMMEPFARSRKQWYVAKIMALVGEKAEVMFEDQKLQTETLPISDIKTMGGKKIAKVCDLQAGTSVRARKPPQLREQDGLLRAMQKYGEKDGKRRLLFIMDEADLCVGCPERNKNQGEKLLFHNHESGDVFKENRGARGYIFGTVFVTATPQALFMCVHEAYRRRQQAHIEAQPRRQQASIETESDSDEEAPRSPFRPHLVYADRPDNYISYETKNWPHNGHFIERRVLPERYLKVKNMTQIYKQVWIASLGSEDDWKSLEKEVREKRDPAELWPGISLRYNASTGNVQVKNADARRRTPEQQEIYQQVLDMFHSAREVQRGQTIWQQDGEAIEEMMTDMLFSTPREEYRHALIISDKTKTIVPQKTLAIDILCKFPGSKDLAVAVYNCKDGIAVRFTEALLADNAFLPRVYQATLEVVQREEPCLTSSVFIHGDELVIKDQPIGVLYESLKHICSRIVVITGEMGGRGVAYHDLDHQHILTDMYTAQEVFADANVCTHGEQLVQMLGRLNTIETFSLRGQPVPRARLWAAQPVHDLHTIVLEEVRELCDAVRQEGDYERAMASRPLLITGKSHSGSLFPLRMSRSAFSAKKEALMRHGGTQMAPITDKRHRGIRVRDEPPLFPVGSRSSCEERLPHDFGAGSAEGSIAALHQRKKKCRWNPDGAQAWSDAAHSLFEVRIPEALLVEAAAQTYCAQHPQLLLDLRAQPWRFKTLQAARGFIAAGAAGEAEAEHFGVMYPPGRPAAESDDEPDDSSESEPQVRTRKRRRLDYGQSAGGVSESFEGVIISDSDSDPAVEA